MYFDSQVVVDLGGVRDLLVVDVELVVGDFGAQVGGGDERVDVVELELGLVALVLPFFGATVPGAGQGRGVGLARCRGGTVAKLDCNELPSRRRSCCARGWRLWSGTAPPKPIAISGMNIAMLADDSRAFPALPSSAARVQHLFLAGTLGFDEGVAARNRQSPDRRSAGAVPLSIARDWSSARRSCASWSNCAVLTTRIDSRSRRSCPERSSESCSASRFSSAASSAAPRPVTWARPRVPCRAAHRSARPASVRSGPPGRLRCSTPLAIACTSSAGSIGGSNSASCRTTPSMFMQWRILKRRSATMSQ